MASEEERKKIMAEFLAGVESNADEEEEEEFGDDDDDDDDDDEEDDEEEEEEPTPPTILKGGLSIGKDDNGNASLIYSGTWSFGLDSPSSSKFKFRCTSESLSSYTSTKKMDTVLAAPHKFGKELMFDGYFIMKKEGDEDGDGSSMKEKIKENGVSLSFVETEGHEGKRWTVVGKGSNQFGSFKLTGEYRFKESKPLENKLHFEKVYDVVEKGGGNGDDDDEEGSSADEDFDEDEGSEGELDMLKEEAEMSVEELRKRAYGGGGGEPSPKKKKKVVEEEDDEF
jgi:hypothetical protein